MTDHTIISTRQLEADMRAVARGEMPAPAYAGQQTFESVDGVMRLLTPENRQLLAMIRDRRPQSIAELAEMSGRAAPNLTRTLAKLEAVGFIKMQGGTDRGKIPTAVVHKLRVEIDPYSQNDHVELA